MRVLVVNTGPGFLGPAVDPDANAAADPDGETGVSEGIGPACTLVVHSREDLVVAAQVRDLVYAATADSAVTPRTTSVSTLDSSSAT